MSPAQLGTIIVGLGLLMPAALHAQPVSEVVQVSPDHALAILGHKVADADGKDVGRLVDVLVDQDGAPTAAVIDFGGFLEVGSRTVAVNWSALHFAPGDTKHPITLDLSADQIKAAPEYKQPGKPAPVVVATPAAPH